MTQLDATTWRPRVDADDGFLRDLFASTREAELSAMGGSELCHTFIYMQFQLRQAGYRAQFPASVCRVIEQHDSAIGLMWVDVGADEIHLLDISLLPSFRGQGLGARLLNALQREAASANRSVSLQVAFANPARRLYARLGFVESTMQGVHLLMRWSPNDASHRHPHTSQGAIHEQA